MLFHAECHRFDFIPNLTLRDNLAAVEEKSGHLKLSLTLIHLDSNFDFEKQHPLQACILRYYVGLCYHFL